MRKIIKFASILITLLLVTIGNAARGEDAVKDLKLPTATNETSQYQVAFCFRAIGSGSATGHAFLAIGQWDEDRKKVTVHGYGFYPKDDSFPNFIIGDGKVKFPDKDQVIVNSTAFLFQDKPGGQDLPGGSCRVLKHVSQKEFNELSALFAQWDKGEYHLISNNCVNMMDAVAQKLKLSAPGTALKTPKAYVEELWKKNGNLPGLKPLP